MSSAPALGRADFIVAPANAEAVAFIDSWPNWPAPAAALYGPSGSGKTHLVHAWAEASGARVIEAAALTFGEAFAAGSALAVENVDAGGSDARALFALFQRHGPLLLTGHEPPSAWKTSLPDLASRFGSLLAFPLWQPDDSLLAALARKLFADRQLAVPDPVIDRILRSIERSPAAVRDFIANADEEALARQRPVTLALVREILDR